MKMGMQVNTTPKVMSILAVLFFLRPMISHMMMTKIVREYLKIIMPVRPECWITAFAMGLSSWPLRERMTHVSMMSREDRKTSHRYADGNRMWGTACQGVLFCGICDDLSVVFIIVSTFELLCYVHIYLTYLGLILLSRLVDFFGYD